jgi:hypothetical protein
MKANKRKVCRALFLAALLLIPSAVYGQYTAFDPFAGDERMSARRTIRAHDTALTKLLADLSEQTGVRLRADPSVAGDRVNLFAHDRPLDETLRAVAAFFRFDWRPDADGYTLYQSAESLREEEAALEARLREAADQIRRAAAVKARGGSIGEPVQEDDLRTRSSTGFWPA